MHYYDVTLLQHSMNSSNADKCRLNNQHMHMHLTCPQCQTSYEVEDSFSSTTVVCHRCGIEFSVSINPGSPPPEKENLPSSPSDISLHEEAETEAVQPPRRKKARLWSWLSVVLIAITAGGIWLQQDAWLDNRWVRSTAINLGIPIMLRDKDWSIDADSVHAAWVIRNDNSKVLVITGRVKNLLSSELPAPVIKTVFYSNIPADKIIARRQQKITLQPGMATIKRTPYKAPAQDSTPVSPLGTRNFTFVIESLPEDMGDFSLTAHAVQLPNKSPPFPFF